MAASEKPIFRAAEILDMAVQIERQGIAFYRSCRDSLVPGSRATSVLDDLIAQEKRHEKTFRAMKSGMGQRPMPESYAGEMQSYLNSYTSGRVFPRAAEDAAGQEDLKDFDQAVAMGIRFESRSIEFYTRIKGMVRPFDHAGIDRIIGEERDHLRRLQVLKEEIQP